MAWDLIHVHNFHFNVIFGANMRSSVHIDNKTKDHLILGEGPTQGLDDTMMIYDR